MKKEGVLKNTVVGARPQPVAERRVKTAQTLEECNRMLAQAEQQAERVTRAAREEAQRTLAQAQRQRDELFEQARREIEQEREQVFQQARDEARAQALEAVANEVGDLMDRLGNMAQQAQDCLQRMLSDQEPEMVRLALTMLEALIHERVEQDDELVLRVVRRALELAGERETITIRIHPDDFEQVSAHVPNLRERFPEIKQVGVEPDARADRGGCLIETRLGIVDARLSRQLARLKEAVLEESP